jgi:hypothetical protein
MTIGRCSCPIGSSSSSWHVSCRCYQRLLLKRARAAACQHCDAVAAVAECSSDGLLWLPLHTVLLLLLLLLLCPLDKAMPPCGIRGATWCALPFLDL